MTAPLDLDAIEALAHRAMGSYGGDDYQWQLGHDCAALVERCRAAEAAEELLEALQDAEGVLRERLSAAEARAEELKADYLGACRDLYLVFCAAMSMTTDSWEPPTSAGPAAEVERRIEALNEAVRAAEAERDASRDSAYSDQREIDGLRARVAALESGLRALLADCEDRLGLENVPYSAFVAARALLEGTE